MNRIGNRCTALAHRATITSSHPYPMQPALSVLSIALTLVYQFLELSASLLVFNFERREACYNVIPMSH